MSLISKFATAAALPVAVLALSVGSASPSSALTAQECSAKYKAAKDAGTLGTMKWNDFRKAECAADATPAAAAPAATTKAATPPPAAAAAKPAAPAAAAAKPAAPAAAAAKVAPATNAVFPKAVDAKYAKESEGKARMHTCRDQYQANKATNANGGLKWIQKGGGYYSQCNAALKG